MVMISVENIGLVRRNSDGGKVTLLADITFSARKGEITAIIGPSGGGKSSLIRLINRLVDPTSGTISLEGNDILRLDPLELRRRVAMVLQKPFMFEGTVLANLQRPFVFRQQPLPAAGSREVLHVMELVRLSPDLLERDARTLSIGEQQRVNLARALITSPQVLLLDEPTSALDRTTGDRLAATLQDICRSQHLTVLLVTHDLRQVEKIADVLVYLEGGRVLEVGAPAKVLAGLTTEEFERFQAAPERLEE
jgi:putative ABC transport system ATP-binding protein